MKHFPFNCFHTVAAVFFSHQPRNRSGVQKGNSKSNESPRVSTKATCIHKLLPNVSFLAFLDYPHFQNYKNVMRQKVPQIRMKCTILHQKCTDYVKTPLAVSLID